jgi:UDP-N-acetylglucosamine--N-acetylmuramyl-(pentapeptide) pyrophosphoryl-undecaprenol N-acetylglucosamine transferase
LAKFAVKIGTGAPTKFYPSYPKSRTEYVGVPVRAEFKVLSTSQKHDAKTLWRFDPKRKLVVVFGGGGGAVELILAAEHLAPELIQKQVQLLIITGVGKSEMQKNAAMKLTKTAARLGSDQVRVEQFISQRMAELLGSADAVITRAGASSMAELAAVAAPTIVVPSPYLAGDHQTKNAEIYAKEHAAIVISQHDLQGEDGCSSLAYALDQLLFHDGTAKEFSDNLHQKFAKPDALKRMTDIIISVAEKGR